MKTIDEIRAAFLRVHHYAMGNKDSAYMSIPADQKRDADLIVSAAIDELGELRGQVEAPRDGAEVALDATLDLASETQRLRERVAELEEHVRKGDKFIGAVERAEKAEAALSRSRNVVAEERHLADVRGEMLTKAEAERDAALAQVAVLRVALERELPEVPRPHVLEVADAQAAAMEEVRVRHINKVRERILSTLASTPAPEHDYSGLCAAPSCEGHCGYVHARGCEAVREYLADHGGEPYRAPSKAATRD